MTAESSDSRRTEYATISDQISSLVLRGDTPRTWFLGLGLSLALMMALFASVGWLFLQGVGIWGINQPVGWGFAITNLVWWIGIGHAGTLISAILLLMRQRWRTSINRFAEAMTLFAVACAGIFPILHLGRPSRFYWLMPYPNTFDLWPQFRSPLVWDLFAILTYALISILFWYMGLIPDIAKLRDTARNRWTQRFFGFLAMGWRGSARHWHRYQKAYVLMAALATPLVVSVHSIVGLDFAISIIPGWHTTISPPFFVGGAVFSGFAMVLTVALPLRKFYGLENLITDNHIDNMAKVIIGTGLFVGYGYLSENFFAWYSGNEYELYLIENRLFGPYGIYYWVMLAFNLGLSQLLWFRRIRQNHMLLFVIMICINIGMWLERFVIVVVSLHRDFLPSAWGDFVPTTWDYLTFFGSIGLFLTLFFLFIRFLPVVSIAELQELEAVDAGDIPHGEHGEEQ